MADIEGRNLSFDDIQKFMQGTDTMDIYLFPNTKVEVGIRVLTQDEVLKSVSEGRKKCEALGYKPNSTDYTDYQMRELIARAVLVPETLLPFFSKPEDVGRLSVDVVAKLVEFYNITQDKYSPATSDSKAEEMEFLLGELKKNSPLGMSLSTLQLIKLVHFLALKLETLQKDSGSSPSPSNPLNPNSNSEPSENLEVSKEEKAGMTDSVKVSTKVENL